MTNTHDALIIGAGQAGPALAGRLTAAGMSVGLIERKLFGGTCVNTGCTPTKTLIASAYAAHLARRAAEYGVSIGGDVARRHESREGAEGHDLGAIKRRLSNLGSTTWSVARSTAATRALSRPARCKWAKTASRRSKYSSTSGGRAVIPDLPGIDRVATLTNTSILELDTLPQHLIVVGGSYIGLEFAQMYRRFGAAVTVVQRSARLLAREDEDVSASIRQILEAEGVAMRLNAKCIHFEPRGAEIAVGLDCASGAPVITGSHVLLAVGRRPNTDDLGLDKAGVETDARGYIVGRRRTAHQRAGHLGARRLQRSRRLHPHRL